MKLLARAETGFGCCGSPADVDDAKRVAEMRDKVFGTTRRDSSGRAA